MITCIQYYYQSLNHYYTITSELLQNYYTFTTNRFLLLHVTLLLENWAPSLLLITTYYCFVTSSLLRYYFFINMQLLQIDFHSYILLRNPLLHIAVTTSLLHHSYTITSGLPRLHYAITKPLQHFQFLHITTSLLYYYYLITSALLQDTLASLQITKSITTHNHYFHYYHYYQSVIPTKCEFLKLLPLLCITYQVDLEMKDGAPAWT
jgi:hypothetical protein